MTPEQKKEFERISKMPAGPERRKAIAAFLSLDGEVVQTKEGKSVVRPT